MITFGRLELEPTWLPGPRGRRLYRVAKDCEVRLNGSFLCVIERGFLTDKTSWPWQMLWLCWIATVRRWVRDRRGRYTQAAVLHDHLLKTTRRPKWQVDLLYKAALRATGVSALEAWLFGSAVRVRRRR